MPCQVCRISHTTFHQSQSQVLDSCTPQAERARCPPACVAMRSGCSSFMTPRRRLYSPAGDRWEPDGSAKRTCGPHNMYPKPPTAMLSLKGNLNGCTTCFAQGPQWNPSQGPQFWCGLCCAGMSFRTNANNTRFNHIRNTFQCDVSVVSGKSACNIHQQVHSDTQSTPSPRHTHTM